MSVMRMLATWNLPALLMPRGMFGSRGGGGGGATTSNWMRKFSAPFWKVVVSLDMVVLDAIDHRCVAMPRTGESRGLNRQGVEAGCRQGLRTAYAQYPRRTGGVGIYSHVCRDGAAIQLSSFARRTVRRRKYPLRPDAGGPDPVSPSSLSSIRCLRDSGRDRVRSASAPAPCRRAVAPRGPRTRCRRAAPG